MGNQLNGWTKGVGPLEIKSHNTFNISYVATKDTITAVYDTSKSINDDITKLKEDISKLQSIMSSSDFNQKNKDLISAIDESVSSLDEKRKRLYVAIAERYESAAEADEWFADKADEYSGYIREKLLGESPKSGSTGDTAPTETTEETSTETTVENPDVKPIVDDNNTGEPTEIVQYGNSEDGMPQFDEEGLLIMQQSSAAQQVINRLFYEIPTHANGTHSAELDQMIDNLSTEECVWLLSRIENGGFGQVGAGYYTATPEAHKAFVEQQVIGRYGGDIHNLIKHWGTYSYSGY